MAVHRITFAALEFTADGDVLLEPIQLNSLLAVGGASGGTITVYSNVLNPVVNSGAWVRGDSTLDRVLWSSGALNASASVASPPALGFAMGLRVEMGTGMKLIAYGE